MPIGNYKDWAECVADQKAHGHSQESADKICGSIEAKSKQEAEKSMQSEAAKAIHAKRKEVARMAQEENIQYLHTKLESTKLRILEAQYEMEQGQRVPYEEDEEILLWMMEFHEKVKPFDGKPGRK